MDLRKRTPWRPIGVVGAVVLVATLALVLARRPFPSDQTPAGAYMRVAQSVGQDDPRAFFAYLETEAQWACFTIHDMRAKASKRIAESYPEPRRSSLLAQYKPAAEAADGNEVFAILYREQNWTRHLHRDLSRMATVETKNERASVVTAERSLQKRRAQPRSR